MKSPLIEPLEARIAPAVISIATPTDSPKNEGSLSGGTTPFVFHITIPTAAASDITVTATTVDGTAHAGEDFTAKTEVITIPAGQTSVSFTVDVLNDTITEADETFTVNLSNPSGGNAIDNLAGSAQAVILNDDAPPTIRIDSAKIAEGNAGDSTLNFTVSLSHAADTDISFDWLTSDATGTNAATAGDDYAAVTTTHVVIPHGQTSVQVPVQIHGDTVNETDEIFFANLTNALLGGTALTIDQAQATGKIGNDERTVSVSGAPVLTEGNSGTQAAQFTVNLSTVADFDVTATFTVAGTGAHPASAGSDFQIPAVVTVTIPHGQTSANFSIPVVGDTIYEANETFAVTLTDADNATVTGGAAVGTILDNDTPPTVSILTPSDSPKNEGSSLGSQTNFDFRVVLSQVAGVPVTVKVSTVDGTATAADGDFDPLTDFLVTVPAGQTQVLATVHVNQDTTREADESFSLVISDPTNATLAATAAQATIRNDDPLPTVDVASVTQAEGDAGTTHFEFHVTLSNPASQDISFDWSTAAGTATAGTDFTGVASTHVTIPKGSTEAILTVDVAGDTSDETDESFFVNLAGAVMGSTPLTVLHPQVKGTIQNDDRTVAIAGPGAIVEGDSGTTNALFTVSLDQVSTHDVKANFVVQNGTAVAGSDFTLPGITSVTIPAGQTSVNIAVPVIGDTIFEADENFSVKITSVENARLGTDTGTATIQNDDALPVLSIGNAQISEGNSGTKLMTFTVSLDHSAAQDITFDWSTLAGTAAAGADYVEVATTSATIPAGQLSIPITVTINGDTTYEADETFTVNVTNAQLGANSVGIGNGTGTGTILNDEAVPTLSIADAQVKEGDGGTKQLTFTVTASGLADQPIEFDWGTSLGTATAGTDYTAVVSNHAAIAAGNLTTTISVDIIGDTVDEADETFFVNIVNAALGSHSVATTKGQATGRILNDDLTVSIVPSVSVTEGNTNTTNAVFAVSIPQASTHDVTVTFTVDDGTAVHNADFQVPGTLTATIPAGQTSANITVPVFGDRVFEGNETFSVHLTGATNAALGNDTAAATIVDDDPQPTLSVSPASIAEGDSGTRTLNFTVSLSNPASKDVTFTWNTVDGSATAGTDYVGVASTLVTIPAGSLSATLPVTINGDTADETDETFSVHLSNALLDGTTALVIPSGGETALGTITNDDATVRIAGGSLTEGNSGTSTLNFAISLLQPSTHDVSVTLQVSDGTAVAGVDYDIPGNLTVTIPAGQTTVNFGVPIHGDTLDEANETFSVSIISAQNAKLGVAAATGTILDDDPAPKLSVSDVSVTEGNAGATAMEFHVTLDAPSGQTVSVLVTPKSGTAVLGTDFTGTAQTITFHPGETDKVFTVQAVGDTVFESNETFTVELSNPTAATLLKGTGTGTITNDDAQPTVSISDVALSEGNGTSTTTYTFTVSLSGIADQPVTVVATTADGTAIAGSDYTSKTQSLTIPAGQTSATFSVNVLQDTSFEGDEQFFVNLTNAQMGANPLTIAKAQGVGTITNDDPAPTLTINDLTVAEGNSGTKTMDFTVTLSSLSGSDVTFDWQTGGGSATPGDDYVAVPVTHVTIPAGKLSATISVTVNGDATDETDENFFINLSNAFAGGTPLLLTDGQGEGKVLNDDLGLSINDVTVNEGDSGETDATFTITLTSASSHEVTVHYQTQDGTATSSGSAADFTAIGDTTLTFAPGETSKTVTVKVHGDTNYDLANSFSVILSQAANAHIDDNTGVGTINDNDAKPQVSIADVSRLENADTATTPGTTLFTFHVTLDHASDETVDVTVSTLDGTAKSTSDYTSITAQHVTFAPGETDKTVVVSVADDSIYETNETFDVVLSDAANATLGSHFRATGTILADTDAAPRLQVVNQQLIEGNSGFSLMTFTVQRIGGTEAPITFHFATKTNAGDTAMADDPLTTIVEAGSDYLGVSDDFTIAPGESSKTIQVKIYGDTVDESDETFSVELTNVAGAQLSPATDGVAKGKILNDDLTVSLQQTSISVLEGNSGQTDAVFLATLSAISTHDVTVTFAVAAGTATLSDDFQPTGALTVTIPAGQQSAEIRVPVQGDTHAETDETFTATLTGATQAQLGSSNLVGTATILNDDAALSISDAVVVEGNSGTRNMVFTVTLEDASIFPVTVHYQTTPNTASEGTDYTFTEGDLTFNAGETTKQILVPVVGDTVSEGDETFTVTLSNPQANGASIDALLHGSATGHIQDDEAFLSINSVSVSEGDNGTSTATFTVTLSPASTFPVTVKVSTVDGTAVSTGGAPDFVAKTDTLTFNAGETTKTFSVTVNGDRVFEAAQEMFSVVLSDATGAAVVNGAGTGTITNSADSAPTISVADAQVVEGDSGTKMLQFTVSLSERAGNDVTFHATTANSAANAATAGVDYTALNGDFTIPAGEQTVTVQIPILGDTSDETDETLLLNISNALTTRTGDAAPTALTITKAQAVGTILNDDLTVDLQAVASVTEGDSGTAQLVVPVVLSQVSAHDVVVTYKLAAGTATAGTDYTDGGTGSITIPAGQTAGNIIINVVGDALDETDETVLVTLTGATNAKLGNTAGTATILDNDAAPNVTINNVTVSEGQSASFTVTLDKASARDITLTWTTANGAGANPATGGDGGTITSTQGDYKQFATPQTLVIPAGSTTATIVVPTVNDTIDERDETFEVHVQVPDKTGGGSHEIVGTATLSASDLSSFAIADASVFEGDAGTTDLVFTVTRTGSTTLASTVHYSTVNGTATAGVDYLAASGDLTFAPGETTKTITITVNGDTVSEIDESLFVKLSSPDGATIGDDSGLGSIRNDEATFRLVRVDNGPLTVDEEAAGGAQQFVEFKIVREGKLDVQATATYTTLANDLAGALPATASVDYKTTTGTILFPAVTDPLVTSQDSPVIIRVPIISDSLAEGDESFKVKITGSVNGKISDTEGEAVVTIHDNDLGNLPQVTISDVQLVEGSAGTSDLVFKVKLVGTDGTTARAAGGPITVTFSTADGTATAGSDYTAQINGTVVFQAGETEHELRVPILGDTNDEADETVLVNLSSAKFAIPGTSDTADVTLLKSQATGTILNDDLAVSVSSAAGEAEGNSANVRIFTLSIPQVSTHDVSVSFVTKDGTAVSTGAFADFSAVTTPTVITIPAGQTSVGFTVTILGDNYAEADESFTLEFSDVHNATMATTSVTATILNDDAAPSLSIGDASIVEGDNGQANLVFTVTLAGATQQAVTVDFATIDGTAKSSGPLVDYLSTHGSLTFAASANGGSQTISVPVLGDTWKELDETFTVELSNAKLGSGSASTSVSLARADATGTILDNGDTTLGLTIRDAKVVEGDSNSTPSKLSFLVETTAPVTGSDVTFTAATRTGTAKANDFTALANKAFTIAVGSSSTTIEVTVTGDNVFEASEFMFLDLKNLSSNVKPVNGSGNSVFARGVILNDDLHVISGREFEYVDVDGDLVNVKFSKGSISVPLSSDSNDDLTFVKSGTVGGRLLQKIDLSNDGFEFAGANIIITAHPQILGTGEVLGNGQADVGAIDAAVPQAGLFQFASGVQLGKIVVPGDLGRIIAGSTISPAGVRQLTVDSLGSGSNLPTSPVNGLASNASYILGPVGKLTVNGDVTGSLSVIGDAFEQPIPTGGVGRIGTLIIKGTLLGGDSASTGQIAFTAGIGRATIGAIQGGTGAVSGSLLPVDGRFTTSIGSLTVLGDITGGTGDNSGFVNASRLGALAIGRAAAHPTDQSIAGNLIGGAGQQSGDIIISNGIGSVFINGDLRGGSGSSSGQIFAGTTLGRTHLTGDLVGGNKDTTNSTRTADTAGSIVVGAITSTLTIDGSVTGGTGDSTGVVVARGYSKDSGHVAGNVAGIVIGKPSAAGGLVGGTGAGSGFIQTDGSLNRLTIYGDIQGGNTSASGGIVVNGNLGQAVISGSLLGGDTGGTSTSVSVFRSGVINAGNIASLIIGGHIESGQDLDGTGSAILSASGSVSAFGTIASLQVLAKDGSDALKGNATSNVVISAGTRLGKVSLGGDMSFAELLAGYSVPTSSAPRGSLSNAGATIGTVKVDGTFSASSIAAGVDAGGDGFFGTLDDQQQTANSVPANQNLVARIASVILKNVAANTDAAAGASFGIVAERVDSVKANGTAVPLHKGPDNDSQTVGDASAKLQILEL